MGKKIIITAVLSAMSLATAGILLDFPTPKRSTIKTKTKPTKKFTKDEAKRAFIRARLSAVKVLELFVVSNIKPDDLQWPKPRLQPDGSIKMIFCESFETIKFRIQTIVRPENKMIDATVLMIWLGANIVYPNFNWSLDPENIPADVPNSVVARPKTHIPKWNLSNFL